MKSESASGKRVGRLFLLCLGQLAATGDVADLQDTSRVTQLNLLHRTGDLAGLLDIKWCDGIYGGEECGLPLFAAADANGDLSLWSVDRTDQTGAADCQLLEILSVEDAGCLALSLDWSTALCRRSVVAFSMSEGQRFHSMTIDWRLDWQNLPLKF